MKSYIIALVAGLACCLLGASLQAQEDTPDLLCSGQIANGDVELTWANTHTCTAADFVASYIYYSETISGPYVLVETVINPTEESIVLPNPGTATAFYFMNMECASGFSSNSDTLDIFDAAPPNILGVTVSGGSSVINWSASTSPETFGYWIYNTGNGAFQLIDSVFVSSFTDPNAPFYVDDNSTPEAGPEEYDVSTIDFCRNTGVFSSIPHKTIHLTYQFDSCFNNIKLLWTAYQGWTTDEHLIYRDNDPVPIATLGPDEFSFDYELTASDGGIIEFTIEATSTDGVTTSRSNEVEVDVELAVLPSYLYLKRLSVDSDGQINLEWAVDDLGFFNALLINRGQQLDDMAIVDDLGEAMVPVQTAYTDTEVLTDRTPYYYFLEAENSCGVGRDSDPGRTMLLQGVDNLNRTHSLNWNAFELPFSSVKEYRLYRLDETDSFLLSTFSATDSLQYVDDVSLVDPSSGQYCYRVEAVYDWDVPELAQEELSSFSNTFCINQISRVYMPNVFQPNGVNAEYLPVFVFPNDEEFEMVIFNRWGETVFQTNTTSQGWDGNLPDGNPAPQGVYAVYLSMLSFNGNSIPRKGTVLLIR